MKKLIAAAAMITVAAGMGMPAAAQSTTSKGFTVVAKNAKGQATQVSKDGQTYNVCLGEVQDSCINPREAGLKWGNWPIGYWPGKPASEIPGKLPPEPPMT